MAHSFKRATGLSRFPIPLWSNLLTTHSYRVTSEMQDTDCVSHHAVGNTRLAIIYTNASAIMIFLVYVTFMDPFIADIYTQILLPQKESL
jgi:hypothetical protein